MTLSGPSAAATCLIFKTPPAASLYAGIPQILFFWIYKIKSPSLCFVILRGICAQQKMANAEYKATGRINSVDASLKSHPLWLTLYIKVKLLKKSKSFLITSI